MRLLLPTDATFVTDPMDDDGLSHVYAYPADVGPERPWVRANFVATLDGAATGNDGHSGSINTGADREVFLLLRALSDVVLVGAGTARTEGYRPPKTKARWTALRARLGMTSPPSIAVVSRSADVPPLLSEQREGAGDVFMITCTDAPPEAVRLARHTLGQDRVIVCGDQSVDLRVAIHELAERGMSRILCEGGPHLMQGLVASGVLDELCLTVSPLLVGGEHPRIVAGPEMSLDLVPHSLIEADGALIGRWLRPSRAPVARD